MPLETLIGIIFMLVIGPAVGNYLCSIVYRLPLGKTPFEQHPFCGHCQHPLGTKDLFPILSWFAVKGKCRYCNGAIPAIYTVIEIACLIVFISYFLRFGISEFFLLYATFAAFVITLAAIHWQQGWIASSIYGYAFTCVALVRTLAEHTIYGWVQGGFVMLVLMLGMLRLTGSKASPFDKPWVWWFVLMGALVPLPQWIVILPIYTMKLLVPKEGRVIVYAMSALALPLFL